MRGHSMRDMSQVHPILGVDIGPEGADLLTVGEQPHGRGEERSGCPMVALMMLFTSPLSKPRLELFVASKDVRTICPRSSGG